MATGRTKGQQRSAGERASHRTAVAGYLRRGWSETKIALELGIDGHTAHNDVVAVKSEWLLTRSADAADHFGRALADCFALEAEAWEAWERSKAEALRQRSEQTDHLATVTDRRRNQPTEKAITGTRKAIVDRRGRDGDPRFLQMILQCQERRAVLLGLDAPPKRNPLDEAAEREGSITLPLSVLRERLPLIAKARAFLAERYPDAEIAEFRVLEGGA